MESIKASDLRIGNWVQTQYGNMGIVKQIRADVTMINVPVFDPIDLKGFRHELLQPIPLTPEILLKSGFTNVDMADLDVFIYLRISEDMFLNLKDGTIWIGEYDTEIKYLHQLQNLYHSLTSHELTINL